MQKQWKYQASYAKLNDDLPLLTTVTQLKIRQKSRQKIQGNIKFMILRKFIANE